jgi:ubiquinone/menaquinone biosynthesis C-methylase UbiE
MAERISPDDPGFKKTFLRFYLRKGIIPWLSFKRNPYRQAFFARYEWVNQYSKDADVLDIPCGMGWGTSLIKHTKSLTGVDIDEASVEEAKQRYAKHATFQVGSMTGLDFPDETFDLVVCLEGIEHVSKEIAKSFVDESCRVLRPGGKLLVTSPHTQSGEHSGNPYHIHEYQTEELSAVLRQNYEVARPHSRSVSN